MFLFFVAVIESQLVPNDTLEMNNAITFPNDTVAAMFGGAQLTIPGSALALQREIEGKLLWRW